MLKITTFQTLEREDPRSDLKDSILALSVSVAIIGIEGGGSLIISLCSVRGYKSRGQRVFLWHGFFALSDYLPWIIGLPGGNQQQRKGERGSTTKMWVKS